MDSTTNNFRKVGFSEEKILLALLPFWTPLIPPLGLSCLKSFLKKNGYHVQTADSNMKEDLRELYHKYFDTLKPHVPENKRGNYYSIGHDLLQNHMMAFINQTDEKEYKELLNILIFKTFFSGVDDPVIDQMDGIIREFFTRLEKYLLDLLEKKKPDLLGLSVYSGTLAASLFAFRLAREKYPSIKTVMGGGIFADELAMGSPNFNYFLEKTPFIDKIIVGEGELLFLNMLQGKLPRSQKVYSLEDIDGETPDLSSLDTPDFTDFNLDNYPYFSAYTSRSCPFQCSFCSETLQWGNYRKKPARKVVEELKELSNTYGTQLFLMGDSLLNPVITDLAKEFLDSGTSIYWDGCLRADKEVRDSENTLLWRKGGFYRARIGIESGSARILELMGKRITPAQNKAAISSLARSGIKTTTLWVIGYPGETEQDFQQTLDFIEELKDDIYEAECRPFYYYLSGQVKSGEWKEKNKSILLYPETAKDMLMVQTWILDGEPSREETYNRMNRFVQHCDNLGIPNPYFWDEIHSADQRWKNLHKNAVPLMASFETAGSRVDECRNVKKLFFASNKQPEVVDFGF